MPCGEIGEAGNATGSYIVASEVLLFCAAADEAAVGIAFGYACHAAHLRAVVFFLACCQQDDE